MDNEQLKTIISNHYLWVNGSPLGEKANLNGANLFKANLNGANLSEANLSGADLSGANLNGANLFKTNLSEANLFKANLSEANLNGADLSGADLWNMVGNKKEVKSGQLEVYSFAYTQKTLQIGCERHLIEDWKNFSDEEIDKMDSQALKWWNKWKVILFQIIEISPAWG